MMTDNLEVFLMVKADIDFHRFYREMTSLKNYMVTYPKF